MNERTPVLKQHIRFKTIGDQWSGASSLVAELVSTKTAVFSASFGGGRHCSGSPDREVDRQPVTWTELSRKLKAHSASWVACDLESARWALANGVNIIDAIGPEGSLVWLGTFAAFKASNTTI